MESEIIALGPVLAPYKTNEITAGTHSDLKVSRLAEIKSLQQWHNKTRLLGMKTLRFLKLSASFLSTTEHIPTDFDDVFWRTLIGDRTLTERPAQPIYGEYYRRWTHQMSECLFHENSPQIDSLIAELDTPDMVAWSDALERCAMGRRLCVTSKGFIGMVPPRTESCDEIALIFGAATPFVIRHPNGRCDGSKGCNLPFLFVGECYVHGIMDGEAFLHIVPSLNSSRLSFV